MVNKKPKAGKQTLPSKDQGKLGDWDEVRKSMKRKIKKG